MTDSIKSFLNEAASTALEEAREDLALARQAPESSSAQMRHPLDCLVSMYYSFTKSHVLPKNAESQKKILQWRATLASQDINLYVMNRIEQYVERFESMSRLIHQVPDLLLLKYEDMILNNQEWQNQIVFFLSSDADFDFNLILDKLHQGIDFSIPAQEDTAVHKRQVTPGDHLNKLNEKTIQDCKSVILKLSTRNSLIHQYF